jgi:hypothetical protein
MVMLSFCEADEESTAFLRGLKRLVAKKHTSANGAIAKDSSKNAPLHPRELEFIFPPNTKPAACPIGIAE